MALALARESEIMWAAGLFEGEGSASSYFGATRKNGRVPGYVALGMKDEDVVRKFAAIMGIGKIYHCRTGSQLWRWQTTNKRDTVRALVLLYPWVGPRRRKAMEGTLKRMLVPKRSRWDGHLARLSDADKLVIWASKGIYGVKAHEFFHISPYQVARIRIGKFPELLERNLLRWK